MSNVLERHDFDIEGPSVTLSLVQRPLFRLLEFFRSSTNCINAKFELHLVTTGPSADEPRGRTTPVRVTPLVTVKSERY